VLRALTVRLSTPSKDNPLRSTEHDTTTVTVRRPPLLPVDVDTEGDAHDTPLARRSARAALDAALDIADDRTSEAARAPWSAA
jgi:hypothetical protein